MRTTGAIAVALAIVLASEARASTKCPPDSVRAGTVCMDTYEASVWRVPGPAGINKVLATRIQKGKATVASLTAGGATQLGVSSDDYTPCTNNGSGCTDVFAVSLPGVAPSAFVTWFQALEACKNAQKRLPTNVEWQMAVTGSPDPGPDNGTTDCSTANTFVVASTGSRTSCVSSAGAFDMVGNLVEWVADWVPIAAGCPGWGAFSNDAMCLSGADTAAGGPGALLRGGGVFLGGAGAGPLAVNGLNRPSLAAFNVGFRCAR